MNRLYYCSLFSVVLACGDFPTCADTFLTVSLPFLSAVVLDSTDFPPPLALSSVFALSFSFSGVVAGADFPGYSSDVFNSFSSASWR
jgi:hypothetical protein